MRIDDDQPTYYNDDPMKVSSSQTGQRRTCTFWMIGKQDTWEQRGEGDVMEHAGIHGRSDFNYNLFRWSDPNLTAPPGASGWAST